MPLAAILGVCLLLPWPQASIVLAATGVWQSAPSNENQASNMPAQSSSARQATEQQESPNRSTTPSQPPATAPNCPENSQSGSTAKPDCKPKQSAKTKKHHETHKAVAPAPPAPAGTTPEKKVVKNGGTDEPTVDLSPDVNQKQASEQAKRADQLLASSNANLKKISGRQLSASQQDTVKQIQSYMDQVATAKKNGDMQRAYNLAVKANLLSAELAGP
ncbi:MAG: hypothetical protein WBQ10_08465 [Terriglobales bacterium]